jgi:hypothetical protein
VSATTVIGPTSCKIINSHRYVTLIVTTFVHICYRKRTLVFFFSARQCDSLHHEQFYALFAEYLGDRMKRKRVFPSGSPGLNPYDFFV